MHGMASMHLVSAMICGGILFLRLVPLMLRRVLLCPHVVLMLRLCYAGPYS